MNKNIKRFLPLLLTVTVILLDQVSKLLVVKNIGLNQIYRSFFGDFIQIVHVRNTGAAFSFGAHTTGFLHTFMLIIVPVLVMVFLLYLVLSEKNSSFNYYQKFILAGIAGGGIGNLIDRILRSSSGGVIDFISVRFYGLFGLDRFPTFNIADSSVVVCAFLLIISFVVEWGKKRKNGCK